ncbi:hypothetical protein ACFFUS_22160 [Vibrio gallaecicus]|uniref:hypothetical protein n=1 Tax=Vibrio gallaecicus TaxID=552386 RepID=UPI0010C9C976|nr:hypothetical protein [Vibrio gallaecicus]MDN3617244.1 hypothetical protein [Vibrio gallaecicus]
MTDIVQTASEVEIYRDLIKIGIPALVGLAGGLLGGYLPYRIQKAKLDAESVQKDKKYHREQLTELIDNLSVFSGDLSSYISILISMPREPDEQYNNLVKEMAIRMYSSESKFIKARILAGFLGGSSVVEKMNAFNLQSSNTLKVLLINSPSGREKWGDSLKELKNSELELMDAIHEVMSSN